MLHSTENLKLAISQPMFFPWVGLFEQIKLSDIFIHYDDVQYPQGRSFISRVQIKTSAGVSWLTAQVSRAESGHLINQTILVSGNDWRGNHLKTLKHSYAKAPFFGEMFDLASDLYSLPTNNLSEFNINSIEKISDYFGLKTKFFKSSDIGFNSSSSEKLLDLCLNYKAADYITGLGAINYLDYSVFENNHINVNYMKYKKKAYPQLHGEFTPFVSILDAIANLGKDASNLLCSNAVYWKDFLNE